MEPAPFSALCLGPASSARVGEPARGLSRWPMAGRDRAATSWPSSFEERAARVLEAVVNKAVMALADRRILTFDVVGTLIDFEAGILGCLRGIVDPAGKDLPDLTLLAAFARAEDAQQHVSPATPFTQMLNPIYERMATEFGLPRGHALGAADGPSRYGTHQSPSHPSRASMKRGPFPMWPAFPTSEY